MNNVRIGLLVAKEGLRKWQIECLEKIKDIPQVKVVLIVQEKNEGNRKITPEKNDDKRPSFLKRIVRLLFTPSLMHVAKSPEWLNEIPVRRVKIEKKGVRESFEHEDLDGIKHKDPDLLIRFGFGILSGDILNVARYGIWSFHHGDLEQFRGRPPVFWELYNGKNRAGITLQRLTEKLDGGRIINRGFIPVIRGSYRKTLRRLYAQSALLLSQSILKLINGKEEYKRPEKLGQVYKNPEPLQVFTFLFILLKDKVSWFIEKSFFHYDWKVGIQKSFSIDETKINSVDPVWLPGPHKGFYADPEFSPVDSDTIFVEYWSQKKKKGRIRMLNINTGSTIADILDEEFHLSFPKIYDYSGNYWMIPEMAEAGMQRAYKMDDTCSVIIDENKLVKNVTGLDPIFLKHQDLWWAFVAPKGEEGCYHLNLFYSDFFFGPYSPHSLNPVVVDPHGARMAGSIFEKEGKLFRFGQVYEIRYGKGVDIFEIKELSKTNYLENRVGSFRCLDNQGLHSVEIDEDRVLIDGYHLKFSWRAGIDRLAGLFN